MGVKPESGGFYREEAARLASEAARAQKPPPEPPKPPAPPPYIPPVLNAEPNRPVLAPEPASNQNIVDEDIRPRAERRTWTAGRILAWIILLPLYVTMAAVSLGLIGLFAKDLLGL